MKKSISVLSLVLAGTFALTGGAFAEGKADNGKNLYDAKCAKCHGKTGGGDGKSAKALSTPAEKLRLDDPARYSDKSDARMAKAIKMGGPAVGMSKEMDKYSYSDQEIQDILAYIRTLAKK